MDIREARMPVGFQNREDFKAQSLIVDDIGPTIFNCSDNFWQPMVQHCIKFGQFEPIFLEQILFGKFVIKKYEKFLDLYIKLFYQKNVWIKLNF